MNYWDTNAAFPSRTALFIRKLADEIAPASKITAVVESIGRYVDNRNLMPDDFTNQEKELARMLAPTDAELDGMRDARIDELKKELAEATKRDTSLSAGYCSLQAECEGLNKALYQMRKAFEAAGLVPPEDEGAPRLGTPPRD